MKSLIMVILTFFSALTFASSSIPCEQIVQRSLGENDIVVSKLPATFQNISLQSARTENGENWLVVTKPFVERTDLPDGMQLLFIPECSVIKVFTEADLEDVELQM